MMQLLKCFHSVIRLRRLMRYQAGVACVNCLKAQEVRVYHLLC